MRILCTDPSKIWRKWFAWRPVYVSDTIVWWEILERKLRRYGYDEVWEYRFPND